MEINQYLNTFLAQNIKKDEKKTETHGIKIGLKVRLYCLTWLSTGKILNFAILVAFYFFFFFFCCIFFGFIFFFISILPFVEEFHIQKCQNQLRAFVRVNWQENVLFIIFSICILVTDRNGIQKDECINCIHTTTTPIGTKQKKKKKEKISIERII